MTAETTLRVAKECPNVIGIKEASGNISQMDEIIKRKDKDFMVISGDDGITFPLITLGAVGVISVIGNAFPREFSKWCVSGWLGSIMPHAPYTIASRSCSACFLSTVILLVSNALSPTWA